jgi:hypothetical protein
MRRHMLWTHGNPQAGFTAVEVLLAASVGLIVMGAFVSFNKHQLGTLRNQTKQVSVQGTARSVAQLFTREVRRADSIELVPAENGMRIRADVNLNGTINSDDDSPDEDVTYAIYDDSILRKAGGPNGGGDWEELLAGEDTTGVQLLFVNAQGSELTYAQALALATANPSAFGAIRRVRLNLDVHQTTAAGDSANAPQHGARLRADATLRKRFFLVAPTFGVDDAIYSDFSIDTFLASLGR